MTEKEGYGFTVDYGENVNRLLELIKGLPIDREEGHPFDIFKSRLDPDILIIDSPGINTGATIFTPKEEKKYKVKELEQDFKKLKEVDDKLEELLEKYSVKEITDKY
ncbi:MAG: hypothetical protein J7L45_01490 [Candidatus Aenigmarchaeota archaeon]|nr:hypothetical protein [Candidatus Aenigmarchaeota archaeon]